MGRYTVRCAIARQAKDVRESECWPVMSQIVCQSHNMKNMPTSDRSELVREFEESE